MEYFLVGLEKVVSRLDLRDGREDVVVQVLTDDQIRILEYFGQLTVHFRMVFPDLQQLFLDQKHVFLHELFVVFEALCFIVVGSLGGILDQTLFFPLDEGESVTE